MTRIWINFTRMKGQQRWKRVTIKYIQQFESHEIQDKFSCQCGKFYQNFPALYLHFKRAHNKKISTRVEDEICIVQRTHNRRNFIYYYTKQLPFTSQQAKEKNCFENLFEQFCALVQDSWKKFITMRVCSYLSGWLLHVEENSETKQMCTDQLIKSIPSKLGQFLAHFQSVFLYQGIYELACYVASDLAYWLYKKFNPDVKIQNLESQVKQQTLEQ